MIYWRNISPLSAVLAVIAGIGIGIGGPKLLDASGLTAESIVWKLLGAIGGVMLLGAVVYSVKKFFSDF